MPDSYGEEPAIKKARTESPYGMPAGMYRLKPDLIFQGILTLLRILLQTRMALTTCLLIILITNNCAVGKQKIIEEESREGSRRRCSDVLCSYLLVSTPSAFFSLVPPEP